MPHQIFPVNLFGQSKTFISVPSCSFIVLATSCFWLIIKLFRFEVNVFMTAK